MLESGNRIPAKGSGRISASFQYFTLFFNHPIMKCFLIGYFVATDHPHSKRKIFLGINFLASSMMLGILTLISCKDKQQRGTLFTEIRSSQSQVVFRNEILEDENYNIDTYEYLYNGGGVATADLNNDGLCDLVFSGNMTPSKIYINKGNLRFEDVTDKTDCKTCRHGSP